MKNKKHLLILLSVLLTIFMIFFTIRYTFYWPVETRPKPPTDGPGADFIKDGGSIYEYLGRFETFSYYTVQASWIFTIFLFVSQFKKMKYYNELLLVQSINMTIVGMVFWFTIAPWWSWGAPIADFYQVTIHTILPIVAIAYYLINKAESLDKKTTLKILYIHPLTFLFFAFVFYISISGDASIYPFTNFYKPFSIEGHWTLIFLINIIIFVVLGAMFYLMYEFFTRIKVYMFKNKKHPI